MTDPLLCCLERAACLYCLPAIVQDVLEEPSIFAPELVALLALDTLGKRCIAPQPLLHIPASPLNDVRQQALPFCVRLECGVEQAEQRPEALLDAAVWGRCHQDDMSRRIRRKRLKQLISLMLNSRSAAGASGDMGLVNNDQVGRVAEKGSAMAL